ASGHGRPARGGPASGPVAAPPQPGAQGRHSLAAPRALRMPLSHALPVRRRALRQGGSGASRDRPRPPRRLPCPSLQGGHFVNALPSLESVVTPALLVDGPVLLDNLRRMAERADSAGVALWP